MGTGNGPALHTSTLLNHYINKLNIRHNCLWVKTIGFHLEAETRKYEHNLEFPLKCSWSSVIKCPQGPAQSVAHVGSSPGIVELQYLIRHRACQNLMPNKNCTAFNVCMLSRLEILLFITKVRLLLSDGQTNAASVRLPLHLWQLVLTSGSKFADSTSERSPAFRTWDADVRTASRANYSWIGDYITNHPEHIIR